MTNPHPSLPTRAPTPAPTPSFAQVAAQSELYRVIGLSLMIVLAVTISAIRWQFVPDDQAPPMAMYAYFLLPITYGLGTALMIRRWIRERRPVPKAFIAFSIVFESLVPTGMIIMVSWAGIFPRQQALTAPVILSYGLIIIMSTLRLKPVLCILTGLLCAAGHLAVCLVDILSHPPDNIGEPRVMLMGYAPLIFVSGVAAGFVAKQIRTHIETLIGEARARQHAEGEIAVAAGVQQGLLPVSSPAFPGFEFAFWNRPADQTCGDYYDWQMLADGKLAVSIADVAGHGLGPALVAAFCRAYARATLLGRTPLVEALARVNSLIAADIPPGRFVTLAVLVLDPAADDAHLISAGHGPTLIRRAATRGIETLIADGPPLGIDPTLTIDAPAQVRLAEGDTIVLLTDGFFEWPGPDGQRFGVERLKAAIAGATGGPADILKAMREAVEAFTQGVRQQDDLTAVAIQRTRAASNR